MAALPVAQAQGGERASAVTVKAVGDEDAAHWNAFVDRRPEAEIYHRYEWRGILQRVFGNDCPFLAAMDADAAVRGILPLCHLKSRLFGNFLVSLPGVNYGGLLADSPESEQALLGAARDTAAGLAASHVELRHRDKALAGLPCRAEKVTLQLELPDSVDVLFKRFKPKLRAQIRRPTKDGATCRHGGAELLDDFYAVFSRNMRDLGTPVYPKQWFAEILAAFPEASRLFVVRMQDQPVAAGIVLGHRQTLEIPSASALREFNRSSPNMLLYWSIIEYAIEQGYTVFDFGRTTRQSGPWRFKKQWGAEESPLRWHYLMAADDELPRLNPDNPKFRLAVRAWQHLPVPVANWLGPRIVRHLP